MIWGCFFIVYEKFIFCPPTYCIIGGGLDKILWEVLKTLSFGPLSIFIFCLLVRKVGILYVWLCRILFCSVDLSESYCCFPFVLYISLGLLGFFEKSGLKQISITFEWNSFFLNLFSVHVQDPFEETEFLSASVFDLGIIIWLTIFLSGTQRLLLKISDLLVLS